MISYTDLALAAAALISSTFLTACVRKLALTHGVVDVPNERSSHSGMTPRGGGLAIVITVTAAVLVLAREGRVSPNLCLAVTGGGIAVALTGLIDDRRPVHPAVRLAVHVLAATWAVYWLGGLTHVQVGEHVAQLHWMGYVLAVLGVSWVLNLFNFMDGIDGIAASEAIFVAVAGALLGSVMGVSGGVASAALVFAGACGGFLWWNWPPASIFLGDVGSGYLGYLIAVLALAACRDVPAAVWVWLILGGVFFVDATLTLVRRVLRHERVHQGHRSHAYQWLARRWGTHRRVTLTLLMVNLLWLLPCAIVAARLPRYAAGCAIGALVPVGLLALLAGSGRATETLRA